MDYSVEDDNPESSPWATSPQHNRTSFETPQSPGFASSIPQQNEYAANHDGETFSASHNVDDEDATESEHPQGRPQDPSGQTAAPPLKQAPAKRTRQERPHYKLQAKITGLERNSRKDPIFKFDVYVSLFSVFFCYQRF
jgi:hypothetical protein